MPLTSLPTKTDPPDATGIGGVKTDAFGITNRPKQVPADEHERIKDYIIDTATEVGKHDGSTPDSLNEFRVDVSATPGSLLATGVASSITGHLNSEGVSTDLALKDHGHAIVLTIVNQSGSITLAAVDGVIKIDTTGTPRNIQLPSPAGLAGALPVLLIDVNNNANNFPATLVRAAAELIDGVGANKVLGGNGGRWFLWTDGTNWYTFPMIPVGSGAGISTVEAGVAASAGTRREPAPYDHVHASSTGTPVSSSGMRANAEGNASTLARSNHRHDLGTVLITEVASSGALPDTDIIEIDTTSGDITLTLPDPPVADAGARIYTIKKFNTGTNKITLDPAAGVSVEGGGAGVNFDLPGSDGTDRPSWSIYYNANADAWRVI